MNTRLLLDAGSGGRAMQELVSGCFRKAFSNPILDTLDDAALLEPMSGNIAMSTDGYTVTPLFFPGGSIGTLAVHGTVNDVAMLGAKPRFLSSAFILEEGLEREVLERVVDDMAKACTACGVAIVTGDTKVVPKGGCDKLFITTTGIGNVLFADPPSGHKAKPGDVVFVSGMLGDHGLTIMASREGLGIGSGVQSDSQPLNGLVERLFDAGVPVHVLRDPTRGGLATTLCEIAEQSRVSIRIREKDLPIRDLVVSGCAILGLDPLYLANEGKCIIIVPEEYADTVLALCRKDKAGQDCACIGSVTAGSGVILETAIGGERLLRPLEGSQLPRIC